MTDIAMELQAKNPKKAHELGVVYTPVEVVDFILHSVDDLLWSDFDLTLGAPGVSILDPFAGSGIFIQRIIESGILTKDQIINKFDKELLSYEIMPSANAAGAHKIESAYETAIGSKRAYSGGLCVDTFTHVGPKPSVIIGNPPYRMGARCANDNNANIAYPDLDNRIRDTYVARSIATRKGTLYDSYIRAIRWASDRIGNSGVIGFVSGNGFTEKPAMDGIRKCLADEFSQLHVINLRGDIRKNMLSKGRAKEGQNIFGSGSMTGIALTLFVKNPTSKQIGKIYYYDIGDDLKTGEKLEKLTELHSVAGIKAAHGWSTITPDAHGDWLSQRDDSFGEFIVLGDKKSDAIKLFENFSLGIVTNRDAWCYNSSKNEVAQNMERMIDFYNAEVSRYRQACQGLAKPQRPEISEFVIADTSKISWTRALKQDLGKGKQFAFEPACLTTSLYRPFTKRWAYFNRTFNEMVYQMPRIFPGATAENRVICVSGIGARSGFSVNITNSLPDLQAMDNGQCFPLYLYDTPADQAKAAKSNPQAGLFNTAPQGNQRRDAITDAGLEYFQTAYPGESISKEDLFYYIYGLLHSEDYRTRYANNLSKELPRIPRVKTAGDFWAFSQAGRDLAHWHLNYETIEPYPLKESATGGSPDYRVQKMKFAGKPRAPDKTTIIYNGQIRLSGIPLETYEYVVNGKPALAWIMERYQVKVDKKSGIKNDPNDWSDDPRYIVDLVKRIVRVSLETVRIVKGLPGIG